MHMGVINYNIIKFLRRAGQLDKHTSDLEVVTASVEKAKVELTADFAKQLHQLADQAVLCGAEGEKTKYYPLS